MVGRDPERGALIDMLPDELLAFVVAKASLRVLCSLSAVNHRCKRVVMARLERAVAPLAIMPKHLACMDRKALITTTNLSLAACSLDDRKINLLAAALSAGALPALRDLDLELGRIGEVIRRHAKAA